MFGTKAALLAAWIDVSVAGDHAPVPFVDRPEAQALADLPTFDERLSAAMAINRAVNERVAAPLAVLDAAAQSDPGIAALASTIHSARHQDIAQLLGVGLRRTPRARRSESCGDCRPRVGPLSVHLYRALVITAGWTARRYERELGARSAKPSCASTRHQRRHHDPDGARPPAPDSATPESFLV